MDTHSRSSTRLPPGLNEDALSEVFIRGTGPGGQNVNKVETAVQLRCALDRTSFGPAVRARLEKLAGRRLTQSGEIVITARRHRTQERNRAEAIQMLLDLIRRASIAPVRRIATRPTRASQQRRLEGKAHRAATKRGRAVRVED